ncbi:MAG: phosphoribosyltransferase family protein [Coriobacteriia bacterium]|nr:phosphoribosyltransferase family protein [Coriobacteriia bacterium]
MFEDREDAGRKVGALLGRYAGAPETVVLGIPRGGVVVAAEVARELRLPLDIVLAAKVGAPGNPEFAVGALTADGELLANPRAPVDASQLNGLASDARAKIARQLHSLRGALPAARIEGRQVIVVDDGLATGLTALAATRYLRRQGAARIVLAVPVAARDSAKLLAREADEFVSAETPQDFFAVGQFYRTFGQTDDSEVRDLLQRAAHAPPNNLEPP